MNKYSHNIPLDPDELAIDAFAASLVLVIADEVAPGHALGLVGGACYRRAQGRVQERIMGISHEQHR
jgi:hypothetical protein